MMDLEHVNTVSFLALNHAANVLPAWFWSSLTVTGHTSMVFALFSALLLPRFAQQGGRQVVSALIVCAILGGVVVTALKEYLQIPRPPAVLSPDTFFLIGQKLELVSTPSGHTVTAFAAATLLVVGMGLKGVWALLAITVATAIGVSRIAVGAHWPLDVLVGAGIGVMCAYLSLTVTKTTFFVDKLQNNRLYLQLQWVLIGLVSAFLFVTDMGYPLALVWQYMVAAIGVMMSSYVAILHLNQLKRS
jgi:membrane-associated phospholipid phosphatase